MYHLDKQGLFLKKYAPVLSDLSIARLLLRARSRPQQRPCPGGDESAGAGNAGWLTVSETDASGVTQTSDYDVYRRLVAQTDGRNNTTTRMYDAVGRLATVTDAAGAVTAYAYDAAGNVSAVTNALGNVIEYAYDVRGTMQIDILIL